MARSSHTPAPLASTQQPIIVMVVADDDVEAARARSITRFVGGARLVEARSGRDAIDHVEARYESPCGCPDIVVLSDRLADADETRRRLADCCPGVRVLAASDVEAGGGELLRELVDTLRTAFA